MDGNAPNSVSPPAIVVAIRHLVWQWPLNALPYATIGITTGGWWHSRQPLLQGERLDAVCLSDIPPIFPYKLFFLKLASSFHTGKNSISCENVFLCMKACMKWIWSDTLHVYVVDGKQLAVIWKDEGRLQQTYMYGSKWHVTTCSFICWLIWNDLLHISIHVTNLSTPDLGWLIEAYVCKNGWLQQLSIGCIFGVNPIML